MSKFIVKIILCLVTAHILALITVEVAMADGFNTPEAVENCEIDKQTAESAILAVQNGHSFDFMRGVVVGGMNSPEMIAGEPDPEVRKQTENEFMFILELAYDLDAEFMALPDIPEMFADAIFRNCLKKIK